ncbi:MAG: diguanylate cyclase [Candidatus Zixiibacteriota bacterium]
MEKVISILLVEDNRDDIELTQRFLKKTKPNFRIDIAYSGKSCLKKVKKKHYHLALLDYSLPEMDGLEVLGKLVQQKPDLPVIMVTGQGDEKTAVRSMKNGALDYIIKSEDYLKVLPFVVEKTIEQFELKKQQLKLEQETRDKKSKLEATLNSTSDGIIVVSYRKGKELITLVNKRFEKVFGKPAGEVINKTWRDFVQEFKNCFKNPDDFVKKKLDLCKKRTREQTEILEIVQPVKMIIECYSGPVYGEKQEIIGRICSFRDITAMKKMEAELKRLSVTDSLTKLYNQGYFYTILERELERARRQRYNLALLLFDIDNFKSYNDKYGHQAGDRIIERVGRIIAVNIRENVDTGYRYGGDEFTIILPEVNLEQAKQIAERIRKSFIKSVSLSLSIGLVKSKVRHNLKSLVKYADKAMYQAKKAGGNRVVIFEEVKR